MTDAANRILHDALKLNEHERLRVAAELLASLEDTDEAVHEAWAAEVARRADDARPAAMKASSTGAMLSSRSSAVS